MFSKDTFKSKTTWGLILSGIWTGLFLAGIVPQGIYEIGLTVIGTFTGVAARDALQKLIDANKGK